ncbi:MAG TPA: hypothetical protein VI756_28655 [Blastocatellia bacterium]
MSGTIQFEERELKPYAQPVSAGELREGEVYFLLTYLDDEMLIPTMATVVFLGRNLGPGEAGILYFQDVQSYNRGVPYDWESDEDREGTFFHCSERETGSVFEYDGALDGLLGCLMRRKARRLD